MGFGEPKFTPEGPIGPRAQRKDETSEEYLAANPQFAAAQEDAWKKKMQEAGMDSESQKPTPEQQQAQKEREEASQMVADHFQGTARIPDGILTPEEAQVLSQMETLYKQQKAANPDQPVKFKFNDQQQIQTYNNLLHKLPLKLREHKQGQEDQTKADEVREKLGLEKQNQEATPQQQTPEETPDSQAAGIKKAFEAMASGIKDNAMAKTQEYHERLLAAQAGNPLKQGDTVENLLSDFKRLTKTEWAPDFNIEEWRNNYRKSQKQESSNAELSEEDVLEIKNEAGKYTRQNNHDINNDLLMTIIDPEIGRNFDAHGIAKISIYHQLDSLINLLQKGINPEKPFFTAPLALRADDAKGSDVAGGTANKTGSFIVLGEMGKSITESGIKHVLVNDAFYGAIEKLSKAFPQVEFIRADKANEKLAEIAKRKTERR
jgi:hypothetical protein